MHVSRECKRQKNAAFRFLRRFCVTCWDAVAGWRSNCTDVLAFVYEAQGEAFAFLESAADYVATVRLARWLPSANVTVAPSTAVLVDGALGNVHFRSDGTPQPSVYRDIAPLSDEPLAWRSWHEPTQLPTAPAAVLAAHPLEQARLTGGLTEFLWYGLARNVTLPPVPSGSKRKLALQFAGARSNAYHIFVNGVLAGSSENHDHWFDPPSPSSPSIITVPLPATSFSGADSCSLLILSENQAFDNSVSPGSGAKLKGLVGEVHLVDTDAPLLSPGVYTISSRGKRWRAADGSGGDQLVTTRCAPNGTEDSFAVFRFQPVDGTTFAGDDDGDDELFYTISVDGDGRHLQCDDAPAGDKRLSTRYQTTDDFSAFGVQILGSGTYRLRVKATGNVLWTNLSAAGGIVSTQDSCVGCDVVQITPVGLRSNVPLASTALNLTAPAGGWRMEPSLLGERLRLGSANASQLPLWSDGATANTALVWLTANFSLTAAECQAFAAGATMPTVGAQRLALDTMGLGRGLAYINGHRLGRYFLIGAPPHKAPTQRYIPVPAGWLLPGSNVLTVLEAAGAPSPSSVRLVRSKLMPSPHPDGTIATPAIDGCLDNAAFGLTGD